MQPKCSLFFVSYVFAHYAAGRNIIRAKSPDYFNLISHGVRGLAFAPYFVRQIDLIFSPTTCVKQPPVYLK